MQGTINKLQHKLLKIGYIYNMDNINMTRNNREMIEST